MHSDKVSTSRLLQVAGMAAAGAILGRVIGGNLRGMVVGGGLGAAVGTASVALMDIQLVLPEGAHLVLALK